MALNEERILHVYLPQGYEASKQKYPMLFVLDADYTPSFARIIKDEGHVPYASFYDTSVTPGKRVIKRLEDVKQNVSFWMSPDFKYVRHELKDREIKFARCGEVAWYSCFLDDCGSYKGKEACLENVFPTGVLEKWDGRWVHVLMHGFYPVDKIPENYGRRFYSNLFD